MDKLVPTSFTRVTRIRRGHGEDLSLAVRMTSQTSPRSSASESLSPQQAAATLSWSAAARPDAQDDERGPIEESESDEDDGTPAASEMTPELIRASAVAGLGGE